MREIIRSYNLKNEFSRFLDYLYNVFIHNIAFIALLFVLNFTTGAIYNFVNASGVAVFTKLLHGAVYIILWCYLVILGKELIRHPLWCGTIKFISILISVLLFVVECFTLYQYRVLINDSIIMLILESNPNEAREFLKSYLSPTFIVVVFLFLLFIGTVYKKRGFHITIKKGIGEVLFVFWMCVAIGIVCFRWPYKETKLQYKTMPPVQRLVCYYHVNIEKIFSYHKDIIAREKETQVVSNKSEIKNIVFVVGESLSKNHMSLYGYDLKTTPNQDSLFRRGELLRFNDVISPDWKTLEVLSMLFSFRNVQNNKEWYKSDLLPIIMRKAGYHTIWLSNQSPFGFHDTVGASIANTCEAVEYCNDASSGISENVSYDEELIPLLSKWDKEMDEKKFVVIHFSGSHVTYKERFPKSFECFTSVDEKCLYSKSAAEIRADYDNSVLYNDFIFSQIISYYRNKEAIVIYLSDHGEEVYDYRNSFGRKENEVNRFVVEIPFVVWMSDSFKGKYPSKVNSLVEAINRPYMSDDIIHFLLELSDIEVSDYNSNKSIINKDFIDCRKRLVHGVDYDKELKGKECSINI